MRKTARIVYLLRRHLEGKLSKDERDELDVWSAENLSNRKLLEEISDPVVLFRELYKMDNAYGDDQEASIRRIYERMDTDISGTGTRIKRPIVHFKKWLPYAAAVLLFAVVGVMFWKTEPIDQEEQLVAVDVEPGGNKAVLTLPDGSTISLREDQGYIVLGEDGILYSDGTRVLTDGELEASEANLNYMSISVPKGGTYQVVLSDGTKVWLNSSSTLRYPDRFATSRRLVELEGEAYFDVNPIQYNGDQLPFIVKTHLQEVEVLGTQFNVLAYHDQKEVITTLVEGSVAVLPNADDADKFLLKPGDQSTVIGAGHSIRAVEVAQYIAWKDGLFYFKNTSFEEMMNQVAKWYDIEVVYKNNVPTDTFTGKMSRSLSLMSILELLNVSNVSVRIEGRTLIVN